MRFLIACHECDLLLRSVALPQGGAARCPRCGALLYRHYRNSLERALALTLAGIILFAVANWFPFLSFKLGIQVKHTTLLTGVAELYRQGMWILSMVVLVTSVLVPLGQLLGMLYILLPLKLNRNPWKLSPVLRVVLGMRPWGMMEVFMLGILVSTVKLSDMAEIVPGIALYSFLALIFVLAASVAVFDPKLIWERLDSN